MPPSRPEPEDDPITRAFADFEELERAVEIVPTAGPFGAPRPLEQLSAACRGGFLAPFVRAEGWSLRARAAPAPQGATLDASRTAAARRPSNP